MKQEKERWVANAPTSQSHRSAMPTVWAFSAVLYSFFQDGLLTAVKRKQMDCYVGLRQVSQQLQNLNGGDAMPAPKGKKKFLLWAYPSTLELVKNNYRKDKSKSQSEFIDRAIRYYIGHVTAEEDTSYLPNAFLSNMKSIVAESDNRQSRLLFKLAVEIAILQNLIAATNDIDPISLERLRGECVKEVKRLNGSFSFEDAVDWQKG